MEDEGKRKMTGIEKLKKIQKWLDEQFDECPGLGDKYWNPLQCILDE